MTLRDPRAKLEALEQEIALSEREIKREVENKDNPKLADWKKASNLYHFYFYNSYKILLFRLNRGDSYVELHNYFSSVIDALEEANRATLALPGKHPDFGLVLKLNNLDKYKVAFGLLFFAISLKFDAAVIEKIIALIPVGDMLLDSVLVKYKPDREIGEKLYFPKEYRLLYDVIESPENKKNQLLKKYFKKWESKFDDYTPYWCFEAAAVIKAFNLDDTEFTTYPHYPYELMHW